MATPNLIGFGILRQHPVQCHEVFMNDLPPYVEVPTSDSKGAITFSITPATYSIDPKTQFPVFTPMVNWVTGDLAAAIDENTGVLTLIREGAVIITVHQAACGDFDAIEQTSNLDVLSNSDKIASRVISDVGICSAILNPRDGVACTGGQFGSKINYREVDSLGRGYSNNFNVSWWKDGQENGNGGNGPFRLQFWVDTTNVISYLP